MLWIKRFFADLGGAQVDGVRFARAVPAVFLVMAGWEFAQHVVEVRIGFFASADAAKAVGLDGTRLALGWVKMILVYVGEFLALRYLFWKDAGRALRPTSAAARRYAPYAVYSLIVFAFILYAGSFAPPGQMMNVRGTIGTAQLFVEPLLMLWVVAAATEGEVRGPLASARRMGVYYLYALPLYFLARVPVGAAHQLLHRFAMGRPPAMLWPLLVVDAVVVGLLIGIVAGVFVRVVRRIDEARGERAAAPPRPELALQA